MPIPVNTTVASVVGYTRLEPRTRYNEFELRAQVHDALWMLTQQWRVGEFKGEDAGTAVKAKIEIESTKLNRFKSRNGEVESYDHNLPMEAKAERLPMLMDLAMQMQLGRQWFRIMRKNGTTAYEQDFLADFPFQVPAEAEKLSNSNAMKVRTTVTGRIMNGEAFYNYLKTNTVNNLGWVNPVDYTIMATAEAEFRAWFENVYYQPITPTDNSWSASHLEYQLKVSAPESTLPGANQTVLTATEYSSGSLDWYSFDIDPQAGASLEEDSNVTISNETITSTVTSYIPSPVNFKGMPVARWWEFEDRNIDLARMLMQKQDISKMLVMEFGLIYSNDWFIVPHSVETGSLCKVKGLVVTDVFGRQTLINRAGEGAENNWQRWNMFTLSKPDAQNPVLAADEHLFVPPSLIQSIESEPVEKVSLLRDEMANMVWGVEEIIPDELGGGVSGKEAYYALMDYFTDNPPVVTPPPSTGTYVANDAKIKYRLSNTVPENWIPFVPANTGTSSRQIALQRAAMYRVVNDQNTYEIVRPRTDLLSYGLDNATPMPYFINEEEVLRSGTIVTTSYQRARWHDGSVFLWLGRKRRTGRGEGSSGLKFDAIEHKDPDPIA